MTWVLGLFLIAICAALFFAIALISDGKLPALIKGQVLLFATFLLSGIGVAIFAAWALLSLLF